MPPAPLPPPVLALLAEQDSVVARSQLLDDLGVPAWQLRRWLTRGWLVVVHPGVYVAHTGPLTWQQRAWAAVLHARPAALHGISALRAAEGPGRRGHDDTGPVHVAVARDRPVRGLRTAGGVVVHRVARFGDDAVQWNRQPPRQRYAEASVEIALRCATRTDGLAVLAAGVQARRTVAAKLADALQARRRVRNRAFWVGVLRDVADGACSVLERAYVERVERAHGLPAAERQQRGTLRCGVVYRDNAYDGLLVELDGRLHHDTTRQRDADMERDLDSLVEGRATVRLSYGQVFDRPCATAQRIGMLLVQRGWEGAVTPCGAGCVAARADA